MGVGRCRTVEGRHPRTAGGTRKFVADNEQRLGVGYGAFAKNLNGSVGISYRTFMRAVAILGYTKEEYDARIVTRIEAERRRSGAG